MFGKIIDHEIIHYTAEKVEYDDAAEAVKGIAERMAKGWSVMDRRHDGSTVTVDFRRDESQWDGSRIVNVVSGEAVWLGTLDDLLNDDCNPFERDDALKLYRRLSEMKKQ